MKTYKYFNVYFVILGFILIGVAPLWAQQVQSDYQIQQDFIQSYKELSSSIDDISSTGEADSLIEQIKHLEQNYSEHENLLNKALYPDTFEGKMKSLKKRSVSLQNRLQIIHQQGLKLEERNQKLAEYSEKLASLTAQADSLEQAISKSVENEKQLSNLVRRYRENLEKRDELILSIVDSVMIVYRNLDLQSLQDLENAQKRARFNSDGNALTMIRNITEENLQFLASNPELTVDEYLRMNAVHKKFAEMWNQVGRELAEIYAGDDPEKTADQVGQLIREWGEKVDRKTWAALNSNIQNEGIDLPEFNDKESFYHSLDAYLTDAVENNKGNATKEEYNRYRNFYSLWNQKVRANWAEHMIDANILSNKQMASIDNKLDQWASIAKPESNLLVYLFGASVLALVVLGVILVREKVSHQS